MRQVLIRMPADLHDELKRHADVEDRTMAATVRRALREYLINHPHNTTQGEHG